MPVFQKDSYYAWWASKATQRLSSKLAHGSKQRVGWRGGAQPPPPFANTVLACLASKETHMLSSKLAQAGGWWGAARPVCKHTARIVNGAVSNSYNAWQVSTTTQRLSSKLAHGLKQWGGRGLGSAAPPTANTMLAWLVSKKSYAVMQACTSGGLGGRRPPHKHTARMVNGGVSTKRLILRMVGFKKHSEAVKQACKRLKTAGGLGEVGAAPPPFANTIAWLVSKTKTYMLSSKLAQAGGWNSEQLGHVQCVCLGRV